MFSNFNTGQGSSESGAHPGKTGWDTGILKFITAHHAQTFTHAHG